MASSKGTVYIKHSTPEKPKERVKEEVTVLYELSAVFPFQLFPDRIVIDRDKVTIIRKELFFKRVFPILIDDIRTVKVTRGPFFASLDFEVIGYESNPTPTTFLWPHEASKAEQYIIGLIKARREGMDLKKLNLSQIKKVLRQERGGPDEDVKNLF